MKTAILTLSIFFMALASCSDKNDSDIAEGTNEAYINATSKTDWQYFSLSENKLVGSGAESEADNQAWAARKDWDFAVCSYKIRTNSGAATSASAAGGVFAFGQNTDFNSVNELPFGAAFATDKAITQEGMSGTTTTVMSDATVILFKLDDEGNKIMPPVYLQAPLYLFRTADGERIYKLQFTQYQNEDKVSGHVKFYFARIQ